MSYTPSPVSSHAKDAEERYVSASFPDSNANNTNTAAPATYAPKTDAPVPVEPIPTTGFWKYVPFQYMSLKPKIVSPYITTAISCMGGLLFGFASTNLTPFISQKYYEEYFKEGTDEHPEYFTAIQQSGMTASMPGGALIGSVLSAFVSDRIGRRGMVEFSSMIWIIGCAIQTSAINRPSLAFGRIIASIGVGTASSNVPMYLAEMVPAKNRGRFLSCFQLSVNIGILVMFYIGWGCSFIHSKAGFRLAWGIQMVPGALMLLGSMFLNESPRWLASKGRWEEVITTLSSINHADPESAIVQHELETFQAEMEVEKGSFWDLFRARNRKQTFCAFFTMLTQQYCGCNAILYFSTSITKQVGYTGSMNQFMGSVDYIVLLAATIPAVLFFDKVSRRHNMMFGAFALLTALAIVAGIEGADGVPVGPEGVDGDPSVRLNIPNPQKAKAALAFSYIYLGFFSLSWGPMAWVYVGEIFNQDVRSVGNAFASIINWLFNFTLTIYTQTSFEHITWKTYVIFAVFAALAIPVVFFVFPETSGYELEQIAALFESNIPAYKSDPWYIMIMKRLGKEVELPEPVPKEADPAAKKITPVAEHSENTYNVE